MAQAIKTMTRVRTSLDPEPHNVFFSELVVFPFTSVKALQVAPVSVEVENPVLISDPVPEIETEEIVKEIFTDLRAHLVVHYLDSVAISTILSQRQTLHADFEKSLIVYAGVEKKIGIPLIDIDN